MTDKFAVLVDAGFLLAVGNQLAAGTSLRSSTTVLHERLLNGIRDEAAAASGLEHLRTYWYDAKADGSYGSTQHLISFIPGVKVRLGRMSFNGVQKGVDLKIGLDLVNLARNRSVETVYLIAGDDDLAEAVDVAQELGVRVTIMSARDNGKRLGVHAVADHLASVADEVRALPDELFTGSFIRRESKAKDGGTPLNTVPLPTPPKPKPGGIAAEQLRKVPVADAASTLFYTSTTGSEGSRPAPFEVAEEVARRVAKSFYGTATQSRVNEILEDRPLLPNDIDGALLKDTAAILGEDEVSKQPIRRALRESFWETIDELV